MDDCEYAFLNQKNGVFFSFKDNDVEIFS